MTVTSKQIAAYNNALEKKVLEMDDNLDFILNGINEIVVDGIIKQFDKNGNLPLTRENARRIYKAMDWDKIQKNVYNYIDDSLDHLLGNVLKNEISSLQNLYPESTFVEVDVSKYWKYFQGVLKECVDPGLLMAGSQAKVTSYFAAVNIGTVTDNIDAIKRMVSTYGNTNLKYFKVEYQTMQNNLFQKMRQDFFDTVPIKGKKEYIYTGGYSKNTRSFCAKHLGITRPETYWRTISNTGTGGIAGRVAWDVKGGWNCRHYLLLIGNTWDKKQLMNDFRLQIKNV